MRVGGLQPGTKGYVDAEGYYITQLVLRFRADEEERIGCYKAGKTTIYKINVLLVGPKRTGLLPLTAAPVRSCSQSATEGSLRLSVYNVTANCKVGFNSGGLCRTAIALQLHAEPQRSLCRINPSTTQQPVR